jgi:acyl carrier protein
MADSSKDSIPREVRRFLAEELQVNVHDPDFRDDLNLFDAGFLDSLGFARLVSHLEAHYGIRFEPQELFVEEMMTVNGLAKILAARKASAD